MVSKIKECMLVLFFGVITTSCIDNNGAEEKQIINEGRYFFFDSDGYKEIAFINGQSAYLYHKQERTFIGKLESDKVVRDSQIVVEILTEEKWLNAVGDTLTVFPIEKLLFAKEKSGSMKTGNSDVLYRNSLAVGWVNGCRWLECSEEEQGKLLIEIDTTE